MKLILTALLVMTVAGLGAAQSPAAATKTAHRAAKHAQTTMGEDTSAAAPTAPAGAPSEAGKKRDPFVNPIEAVKEGKNTACAGGKRCLQVNEIILRGVVKSVNGMIAVVENSARRTYFLRENDPIYNGFVKQITPDSLVLREHYLDNLGRDAERDVVKTVNAPVV